MTQWVASNRVTLPAMRWLWVLAVVLAGLGCQPKPGPADSSAAGPHAGDSRAAAIIDHSVPLPPGLAAEEVGLHQGDALQRAQMPLETILADLPRPDYLPPLTQPQTRPQPKPADQNHDIGGNNPGDHTTTNPTDDPTDDTVDDSADAVDDPPIAAQRAYLAGRMAWLERKNYEAIGHLQAALRLVPHSPRVLRLLGQIYTQSGNKIRGGVYLEKAVTQQPNDIDSLYLLGRLAGEQGRWSNAIATLAYAVSLQKQHTDPALPALMGYFLGHALTHEGYEQAAVEQLTRYLELPTHFRRTTRMVRELVLLSRQRSATWESVGDAYCRLGQPAQALSAYRQALGGQHELSIGLTRRMVYVCMQLKQPDLAWRTVLKYMDRRDADAPLLDLVQYLSQQGVERSKLAMSLRKAYDRGDHPSSLAVTIADLLEPTAAGQFLHTHLQAKPADRAAFAYLTRRLLDPQRLADPQQRAKQIDQVMATLIETHRVLPSATEEYTALLIQAAGGNTQPLLDAIDQLAPALQGEAVVRYVVGVALGKMGRVDDAVDQLKQALLGGGDAGLLTVRIELVRLLLSRGDTQEANELLADIADDTDHRVVKLRYQILVQQGQAVEALKYLDGVLARKPADPVDLTVEKAKLQQAMGDAVGAKQTLEESLQAYPRAGPLYEQLLQIYRTNRVPDAEKLYQQLVEQMFKTIPHDRVARRERAQLLVAAGRYEQAEPLLRSLLEENPQDLRVLDPLLTLLVRTDRQPEAQRMLDDRLNRSPRDRHLLTVALHHSQRTEDQAQLVRVALTLLDLLMAEPAKDASSLDTLLDILTQADQTDQATQWVERHLADNPKDRVTLVLARRHYQRVDQPQRVFEVTKQLLLLQAPSVSRTQSLAALYLQHDQPQQAITVITQALEQPKEGDHHGVLVRLLGQALGALDAPAQMDQRFAQAIQRFPQHATDLSLSWALQCERRGAHQQSEQILTQLLEANPDHTEANNALGYAWTEQGKNLDRAQAMIQIAVDTEPDNAAYLDSMGWVLYKQGRFNDAVTWLQRATAAPNGEYPVILNHLGDALYRVGHHKLAVTTWQQTLRELKKYPDSDDYELEGLAQQLPEKIAAVEANKKPPVADAPGLNADPKAPPAQNDHPNNGDGGDDDNGENPTKPQQEDPQEPTMPQDPNPPASPQPNPPIETTPQPMPEEGSAFDRPNVPPRTPQEPPAEDPPEKQP